MAHFRILLKEDRRSDDNLKHKLNAINTKDHDECTKVAKWLVAMHRARRSIIRECLKRAEEADDHYNEGEAKLIHEKHVNLLKEEGIIEDIVEEQSWHLLRERCRVLGDLEKFKSQI